MSCQKYRYFLHLPIFVIIVKFLSQYNICEIAIIQLYFYCNWRSFEHTKRGFLNNQFSYHNVLNSISTNNCSSISTMITYTVYHYNCTLIWNYFSCYLFTKKFHENLVFDKKEIWDVSFFIFFILHLFGIEACKKVAK